MLFYSCTVSKEDERQAAFLTTEGAVRQFAFRLISNNTQLTWDELRVALEEYYEEVTDPNARIVELVNIKQGRT